MINHHWGIPKAVCWPWKATKGIQDACYWYLDYTMPQNVSPCTVSTIFNTANNAGLTVYKYWLKYTHILKLGINTIKMVYMFSYTTYTATCTATHNNVTIRPLAQFHSMRPSIIKSVWPLSDCYVLAALKQTVSQNNTLHHLLGRTGQSPHRLPGQIYLGQSLQIFYVTLLRPGGQPLERAWNISLRECYSPSF